MNKVLVVAPHPDDETLGCGGTLLRHISEGDEVHWLIMTTISEERGFDVKRVSSRRVEIDSVAKAYGFSSFCQAEFITAQLDRYSKSDLISFVSSFIQKVEPNIIYIPYRNDVHSDHGIVFDAVSSCTKSFRYPFVKQVLAYETLSETEFSIRPDDPGFKPNFWVDMTDFLDRKIELMKLYAGEMGEHPFPRSEQNIRALSTFRGGVAGVIAAEAFLSLIHIVK